MAHVSPPSRPNRQSHDQTRVSRPIVTRDVLRERGIGLGLSASVHDGTTRVIVPGKGSDGNGRIDLEVSLDLVGSGSHRCARGCRRRSRHGDVRDGRSGDLPGHRLLHAALPHRLLADRPGNDDALDGGGGKRRRIYILGGAGCRGRDAAPAHRCLLGRDLRSHRVHWKAETVGSDCWAASSTDWP